MLCWGNAILYSTIMYHSHNHRKGLVSEAEPCKPARTRLLQVPCEHVCFLDYAKHEHRIHSGLTLVQTRTGLLICQLTRLANNSGDIGSDNPSSSHRQERHVTHNIHIIITTNIQQLNIIRTPFEDHPLSLDRYRED